MRLASIIALPRVVQLGLFLLLLLVLRQFLWKPYLRVLGERTTRIDGYKQDAVRLDAEAAARLAHAEAAGGWGVPVLVGVFPLTSYRVALRLHNEVPGIVVPQTGSRGNSPARSTPRKPRSTSPT